MCSTTRREERGTFSKLNPPDLPPLHFYQRQSIKRPKIAPFSRNLFIQNPIPPKGTKFLDTRRAFPLVSPPRKNRKQSSIRPVSTCSLTKRSLRGQTADSCGTGCWFSGHVFRLARNPESWLDSTNGYGATGVPDGLLCHVRRFQFSFPDPSVRFLPISLRNVIDNRCIKRSLPTFPPFDFSRNRKSFFFLFFLKSRVG